MRRACSRTVPPAAGARSLAPPRSSRAGCPRRPGRRPSARRRRAAVRPPAPAGRRGARPAAVPGRPPRWAVTESRFRPRSAPTKSATYGVAGAPRTVAGVSNCSMRPSPYTAIRSPSRTASSMSCVTKSTVLRTVRLEPQELVLQVLAHDRVDRAERLVHQQHGRVGRQGAGHADALALTAGELLGVAVAVDGRVEADQVEQFGGAARGPCRASSRAGAGRSRCCPAPSCAGRGRPAG